MKQSKGFIELTLVGWLTLIGLGLGLISGGRLEPLGFTLSYDSASSSLYFTPIVQVETDWMRKGTVVHAFTLGGAIVTGPTTPTADMLEQIAAQGKRPNSNLRSDLLGYEQNHVRGWNAYGLEYGLKIFQEPCRYDPRAVWAQGCLNTMPEPLQQPGITGAIKIGF